MLIEPVRDCPYCNVQMCRYYPIKVPNGKCTLTFALTPSPIALTAVGFVRMYRCAGRKKHGAAVSVLRHPRRGLCNAVVFQTLREQVSE